jgi:hypothetical protein
VVLPVFKTGGRPQGQRCVRLTRASAISPLYNKTVYVRFSIALRHLVAAVTDVNIRLLVVPGLS